MNKERITQVSISILAIIAITYGRLVNFPDAVHRRYGFPLNWGTNQLVSIAGPVDIWSINITNLVINLGFWLLILIVAPVLLMMNNEE